MKLILTNNANKKKLILDSPVIYINTEYYRVKNNEQLLLEFNVGKFNFELIVLKDISLKREYNIDEYIIDEYRFIVSEETFDNIKYDLTVKNKETVNLSWK